MTKTYFLFPRWFNTLKYELYIQIPYTDHYNISAFPVKKKKCSAAQLPLVW